MHMNAQYISGLHLCYGIDLMPTNDSISTLARNPPTLDAWNTSKVHDDPRICSVEINSRSSDFDLSGVSN